LAYNRDLQEDKTPLFDSVDTARATLEILSAMAPRLRVHEARMRAAAAAGYTLATELADYLAGKGVPFRQAHAVVGAIVRLAASEGRPLEALTLTELRRFSPAFAPDVRRWLRHDAAVRRRRARGGTAPANVARRLKALGV
jgi:argininosuccinate lyase